VARGSSSRRAGRRSAVDRGRRTAPRFALYRCSRLARPAFGLRLCCRGERGQCVSWGALVTGQLALKLASRSHFWAWGAVLCAVVLFRLACRCRPIDLSRRGTAPSGLQMPKRCGGRRQRCMCPRRRRAVQLLSARGAIPLLCLGHMNVRGSCRRHTRSSRSSFDRRRHGRMLALAYRMLNE
jgi:hypothetical protein